MLLTFFYNDFIAILPEFFLIVSINIVLLYLVIYGTSPFFNFPLLSNNISWLCIFILLITFYLNFNNNFYDLVLCCNSLVIDLFGIFIKNLILLGSICSLIIALNYNKLDLVNNSEFSIFVLLTIVGTLFLVSSYDLLIAYLAIELQSFCSYILSSIRRNSEFSTEAGLKYFILGAFSSGFLLFGCSLIYGFTGTTNFKLLALLTLNYNLSDSNGILIGSFFVVVSFLFKLSAAPFHFWSPDVYEGSPTTVTAFFSIIHKLGFLVFFLRFFFDSFYGVFSYWQILILIASFLSIMFGSFGAIWQIKLKRLFAFSAIGHVGYILICLSCSSFESVCALIFYIIFYTMMNVNSFSILLMLRKNLNLKRIKYNQDLILLTKTNSFIGVCVGITFFSIAGIPPLAGFFSKVFLFFNAIGQCIYNLSIFGILVSIVSCFYYLNLIQLAYFKRVNKWVTLRKINKEISFLVSFISLGLFIFFIHGNFVVVWVHYCSFALYY